MPPDPRILVIRRRYLGDIVLLGAFFANLRRHRPGARIAAMVDPAYAPILALNPDVDAVLSMPQGAGAWVRLVGLPGGERFTHVFDLDNSARSALVARLTGAPFRATLHLENVRRHFPSFYTHSVFVSVPAYSGQSIVETQLMLLPPAGVPVATRDVRLVPRPADIEGARQLTGPAPAAGRRAPPRILIHPGTRSAFRLWPPASFAAVADALQDRHGAQVFLIGGPGEAETLTAIQQAMQTHVVVLRAPLALPRFAAFAAQFDAMVCHDSGPMHVAAAVGTPVVALFGSQDATVWGPRGTGHVVLRPPLPCVNCVAPDACAPADSYRNYCVRNIAVDRVLAAIEPLVTPTRLNP